MNIDDLTFGEIKQISALLNEGGKQENLQPFEIGKNYLIRTVTHILVGNVTQVGRQEIVINDASWIADTGRYHNCLVSGELNEVEPYPDNEPVIVGRGALVDACKWLHALPRAQK